MIEPPETHSWKCVCAGEDGLLGLRTEHNIVAQIPFFWHAYIYKKRKTWQPRSPWVFRINSRGAEVAFKN